MPGDYIGRQRSNALWRLLVLVILVVSAPIVLPVIFIVWLVYMAIDVFWRLVFNAGRSPGRAMMFLRRVGDFYLGLIKFAVYNDDR